MEDEYLRQKAHSQHKRYCLERGCFYRNGCFILKKYGYSVSLGMETSYDLWRKYNKMTWHDNIHKPASTVWKSPVGRGWLLQRYFWKKQVCIAAVNQKNRQRKSKLATVREIGSLTQVNSSFLLFYQKCLFGWAFSVVCLPLPTIGPFSCRFRGWKLWKANENI